MVMGRPYPLTIIGSNCIPSGQLKSRRTLFEDNEQRVMVVEKGLADKENLKIGQILPFDQRKNCRDRRDPRPSGGQEDEFHFTVMRLKEYLERE